MDLLQHRKALSGAGLAIGFGLLVAWMVPPTEPRQMAANWRTNIKPVAPPSPVDFIGFAPTMAALPAYPVAASAGDGFGNANDVAIHRGRSGEAETPTVADQPVDHGDETGPVARAEMPSHGDGYRWIDRQAAMDRDICDAAPNAAVGDRCRSYFEGRRAEVATNDQPYGADQEDQGDY